MHNSTSDNATCPTTSDVSRAEAAGRERAGSSDAALEVVDDVHARAAQRRPDTKQQRRNAASNMAATSTLRSGVG